MAPRIQHQRLLRLARSQGLGAAAVNNPLGFLYPAQAQSRGAIPAVNTECLRQAPAPRAFTTSILRRQDVQQMPQRSEPSSSLATSPSPPTSLPSGTTPPPPPPPFPPRPSRFRSRRLIHAAVFLLLGTAVGASARLFIDPPTPPTPGSDADKWLTSALHEQAERLPLVRELTADPAWESWDAYNTLSAEHRARHIAAGALAGARGVGGYQRVFYRPSTGDFVSVIFFGGATVGWPGVVHGGTLATIVDESCGRVAFRQWGGMSGVTANLRLEYKAATLADGFYVLRLRARPEDALPEAERGKRRYKCYVDATLEDAATGRVTVIADALFVGGEGKQGELRGKDLPWAGTGKEENDEF